MTMKTFILRLLGRNPKKKDRGHYKLQVEVSRPPDNGTAMPWHTIEAGVVPANEGHLISRELAEILGFDIPAMLEQTPMEKLELCLYWKNLSRDATRTRDYTHRGIFCVGGAGLQHDIVFGQDMGALEGYGDPYEGAVRIESSESRTNSWVSKLSSRSTSWASSRKASKRTASSKRGSGSRHGTGDLVQSNPNAPKATRDAKFMPVLKAGALADTSDEVVPPVANGHYDTTTSLELDGIKRIRQTSSNGAIREHGEHQAVFGMSFGPTRQVGQLFKERADTTHSVQLRSTEAADILSSATVYQDFSTIEKTHVPPDLPKDSADTVTMGHVGRNAAHVDASLGNPINELPSKSQPEHQNDLARPSTPTQRESQGARSVGSVFSRSHRLGHDWNQSQSGFNSLKSESTGFAAGADPTLAASGQARKQHGDSAKDQSSLEHSRLAPEKSGKRNFNVPLGTAQLYRSENEHTSMRSNMLDTQPNTNESHAQELVAESGKASIKSSPKSGSRRKDRNKNYDRPAAADLISPRRVAPSPSDEAEAQSSARQRKGTSWTWDEQIKAYSHIDSDTQSVVWYEDSGSEDM